jgi:hypothetical protein
LRIFRARRSKDFPSTVNLFFRLTRRNRTSMLPPFRLIITAPHIEVCYVCLDFRPVEQHNRVGDALFTVRPLRAEATLVPLRSAGFTRSFEVRRVLLAEYGGSKFYSYRTASASFCHKGMFSLCDTSNPNAEVARKAMGAVSGWSVRVFTYVGRVRRRTGRVPARPFRRCRPDQNPTRHGG